MNTNKKCLIVAHFYGYEFDENSEDGAVKFNGETENLASKLATDITEFINFSTNSNWMFDVVDKIENLDIPYTNGEQLRLEVFGNSATFVGQFGTRFFGTFKRTNETKKEAIFSAIFDFCDWYLRAHKQ